MEYGTVKFFDEREGKKFGFVRVLDSDDLYTPPPTELDELDPFVFDYIVAMIPAFMLFEHRPRDISGCFVS